MYTKESKRRPSHSAASALDIPRHDEPMIEQLRCGEPVFDPSDKAPPSHLSPVEGTHTSPRSPGRSKPSKYPKDLHGRHVEEDNRKTTSLIEFENGTRERKDVVEGTVRHTDTSLNNKLRAEATGLDEIRNTPGPGSSSCPVAESSPRGGGWTRHRNGMRGTYKQVSSKGTNILGQVIHQKKRNVEEPRLVGVGEPETTGAREPPADDGVENGDAKDSEPPGEQPLEEQQLEVAPGMAFTSWKKFLLIQALLVQIVLLIPSILWVLLWILQKLDLGRVAFFVIVLFLLISALILAFFADKPFQELVNVEVEALKAAVRELVANLNDNL